MAQRTNIYTVYECPQKEDIVDRVELVREGFSWLAFFFNILWLLYQRLWIPALGYFLLLIGLSLASEQAGLSPISTGTLQLFLQTMLGFAAYDLKRWRLTRRGYYFTGIVSGENSLSAQRRYYDALA